MRVLVVFHGDAGTHPLGVPARWFARFLKANFKHCLLCIQQGEYWIRLDGLAGMPLLEVIADVDYDLCQHYRNDGLYVVDTEQQSTPVITPFVMNNCVGLVKAFLCIRAPLVWTPWQLYCYLLRAKFSLIA